MFCARVDALLTLRVLERKQKQVFVGSARQTEGGSPDYIWNIQATIRYSDFGFGELEEGSKSIRGLAPGIGPFWIPRIRLGVEFELD